MSRPVKCILTAAACALALSAASAQAQWPAAQLTPQTPLAPGAIPMFMNRLPVLDVTSEPAWAAYPKIETVIPGELAAANGPYTLRMCEFTSSVLPAGTPGVVNPTHVWGYAKGACPTTRDTYLGPVFVSYRGVPTSIRYVNDLPLAAELSNVIAYRDSIDQTLHWADPNNLMCSMPGMAMDPACTFPFRATPIPAVPHLHGGEVPPMLDGGPDAWFSSDPLAVTPKRGPGYYSSPAVIPAAANEAIYTYPNTQEPAPLWFHDHTLGATRLNVFAGLAGGYYLVDENQDIPASLRGLGGAAQVVPIILQDRMFDTNGELFFTSGTKGNLLWALNPEHPYWNPEFVGDTIVVNGKAWPYLDVEQKRYRFLFLNGSNARTYELFLTNRVTKVNGPSLHLIGTDGGYLDAAVKIDPNALKPAPQKLVIMPGERYEVVIDFTNQPAGTRLLLKNVGKTPYPGGATPTGGLGQVMEFRVSGPATSPGLAYDPVATPAIRGAATKITPLVNFATGTAAVAPHKTRQLTLNEVMGAPVLATNPIDGVPTAYPGGPLEVLVNNTKWSGASARNDPTLPKPPWARNDFVLIGQSWYSELPQEGETELWEIVNLTADSHPIHLHLVQFQLVNRQNFDVAKYNAVYNAAFPFVPDPMNPAMPLMVGMNVCSGALYCPGFGPPLDYNPSLASGGKLGGNPDVLGSLKSVPIPPAAQETGWKDTIQAPPGQVTRVLVRWAPTDLPATTPKENAFFPFDPAGIVGTQQFGYVWHCHIIDHEDNEMMRPDVVQANISPTVVRTVLQGTAY